MSRDAVLDRIRAARQAFAEGHASRGAVPDLLVLPDPQIMADPVAFFIERARQVGIGIDTVASLQHAAESAAAWCRVRRARRALVWDTPDLGLVRQRLHAEGVEILPPDSPLELLAQADVGITGAEWGIAETATLALGAGPSQPRLASLLPPVHLAILHADRIVSDLHAFFARVAVLPSALTLITGPSRSADIGSVLVLGAHGPTEVAVLLIDPSRR